MLTLTIENKSISNAIETMKALTEKNKDFRNITVYEKTDTNSLSFIALSDIKKETQISRITFQVLDKETKRNATVYIYFSKDNKAHFECSNTFLKDYKVSDYEELKRFKESRTNVYTIDIEKTLTNLLKHKEIIKETTKAKKSETTKAKKVSEKKAK